MIAALQTPSISAIGIGLVVAGLVGLYAAYTLFLDLFSALRNVPGPVSARFSRYWYLKHVARGSFHETNIALHRKHGKMP